MKRRLAMIVMIAFVLISTITGAAFTEYQEPTKNEMLTSHEFSSSLLQQLVSQSEGQNILFSPLSVRTALSMTALGAAGTTVNQMEAILSFSTFSDNLFPESEELSIANSIFIDNRYPVAQSFIREAENLFDSEISTLDFTQGESVAKINRWVSKATNKKIETIIDSLSPDMRMVLVNAVHFLADWKSPFDPNDTRNRIFHSENGDFNTPFMHSDRTMQRISLGEANGVVLPYKNDRFAFFALLPPQHLSVEQWLQTQNVEIVSVLFDAIENSSVEHTRLALPKFLDRYENRLSTALKALGLTEPFDPGRADFSNMNEQKKSDLFIDEVLHKTFIRVDEKGTEAAAVTAVMMRLTSMMPSGTPLVFDRPFFYGIVDLLSTEAVFLGVMQVPESP